MRRLLLMSAALIAVVGLTGESKACPMANETASSESSASPIDLAQANDSTTASSLPEDQSPEGDKIED